MCWGQGETMQLGGGEAKGISREKVCSWRVWGTAQRSDDFSTINTLSILAELKESFCHHTLVQPSWIPALRTGKFHLRDGEGSGRAGRRNSLLVCWKPPGQGGQKPWDLPSDVSTAKDLLLLVPNQLSGNYVPILWWLPSWQKCCETSQCALQSPSLGSVRLGMSWEACWKPPVQIPREASR